MSKPMNMIATPGRIALDRTRQVIRGFEALHRPCLTFVRFHRKTAS